VLGKIIILEINTAEKIDIPPINGITPECCFLSLGLSTKPILYDKGFSNFIDKNENINPVIIAWLIVIKTSINLSLKFF
jgi:hypothetical protein